VYYFLHRQYIKGIIKVDVHNNTMLRLNVGLI